MARTIDDELRRMLKEEADEMKDRAYQKVKTQFDIHRVAAQHVEMFKDLGCQRNIQCI